LPSREFLSAITILRQVLVDMGNQRRNNFKED